MSTGHFNSFDGSEIFYRKWNFKPSQKSMVVIHRGHEHSERLNDFATASIFSDYNIFAFDLRGHGHTKTETSSVFMDYVRDLDAFSQYLEVNYNINSTDIFVVANSIGGVVASAWVHDYAPNIAGMALLAPAFRINLIVPLANEMITLGTKLNKNLIIKSYVKSTMLTHDVEQQKAYDTDTLITREIDARLLIDLADAGKRLVEDAAAIDTPTLILSAEKDKVVFNIDQKIFFNKLDTELKELEVLPNFFHGILFEKEKDLVYTKIKDFTVKAFNQPQKQASLLPDQFSVTENISLQNNEGNNLNFKFQKWSLSKIGKFSDGMAIGIKHGFDSGASLDYVYHNTPKGKLGFGKMMDKNYLEAIGWRGIRIRKQHLLQLLEKNIEKLQKEGRSIKILDIAGGTGNYLFDIKDKYPAAEIVINEFVQDNIEIGQQVIEAKKYQNVRFTNYDCFDSETYKKIDFEPNIVIISGILELFGDNELASIALAGIEAITENNSNVIYTGQPWHPQLKMIAYVLNSHQKKSWVMRRRSQKELDRLMSYNNIAKETMLIDDFGIFTVSSAKVN
ncbi:bifunctional alpha/beta hydrolase/class I SAM-dependent methyltransferase [Cellulophaga baltica]|uniref:bifunctional alpha/beta hydrolase/class I SAM-dependent methyltransferase n=1 Tax=Cellulophaga TaxID=104264 RepID=UPI001C077675|nr:MULTISPECIES: bifunctional alpha/beta hydrolase/class I SAM-dependent methyltransferase [Cellulophaga]MBU2996815.1 bifunctional alpha/beta hydrolase/class I SAM-dependent methyltransferase [Cellulophaga baltica]MDO6768211.1 bifunctional alpha/beta hydrolase/class I SAM-dependent methyltransferase [Cellulophaga sp. 1_MG-2023]